MINYKGLATPFGKGLSWQSYWTDEYDLVYQAMTVAGATPSNTDALRQSRWLKKIVDGGYYEKAEIINMYAVHDKLASLINWKNPGTFNPTLVGNPLFETYSGFTPSVNNCLNLNFIPSVNSTIIDQNNLTVMIGVGDVQSGGSDDLGVIGTDGTRLSLRSRHTDNVAYFRCNDQSAGTVANTSAMKYYTLSRNSVSTYNIFLNKVKTIITSDSTGVIDRSIYSGAVNYGDVEYSHRNKKFDFIFSYLTEVEIADVIDITEEYLYDYNSELINARDYIATTYPSTKVSIPLTTYEGSGETIHPSVVNIGAEWNGYKYWMANTPFPLSNSAFENPSIWASNDGLTWVVPEGLTNPVIPKPVDGYNADTDLFYNFSDNKLYMIWKEGTTGFRIKMCSSSDGITWGNVKTVLTTSVGETECFTPTLIKIGELYYIYYNKYLIDVATTVQRRVSCSTIDGIYGNRETVNLPVIDGFIWWHNHLKYYNGNYYFVSGLASGSNLGTKIYVLKSIDGINFIKPVNATVYISESYESSGFYRPCLVEVEKVNYVYTIPQVMVLTHALELI